MAEFSDYDSRGYATLEPRAGYGAWSANYEEDVVDEMDLAVLGELRTPVWQGARRAADLGCGERVVDERWLELKPQWERFRHHPVSIAYVRRKPVAERTAS
jgi:hypothetical protein